MAVTSPVPSLKVFNHRPYPDSLNEKQEEIVRLKREKNEANEVKSGTECGISIKEFSDFEVGDLIEAFNIEEIAQSL